MGVIYTLNFCGDKPFVSCRGLCKGYAFTNEDVSCPSDTGSTWKFSNGSWLDAGEGLLIDCYNSSHSQYKMVKDLSCDFVRSITECESAARELRLSDVTAEYDRAYGEFSTFYDPPFCYFEDERLYFNKGGNTGSCTASDRCLCRQNDFCAENSCGEGQGDCDDDTECEGPLVCGHLNCLDSTISDCCTQSCHYDSDCINQECDTEIKGCRLDSYSTHWSRCSQQSPCNDGEGDCDQDGECEGSLVCGNNKCLSRPSTMDCCIGNYSKCHWKRKSSYFVCHLFLRFQML